MDNNVNIFDNERLNDIYQKVVNGEITSTAGLNLTLDELFTMDKNGDFLLIDLLENNVDIDLKNGKIRNNGSVFFYFLIYGQDISQFSYDKIDYTYGENGNMNVLNYLLEKYDLSINDLLIEDKNGTTLLEEMLKENIDISNIETQNYTEYFYTYNKFKNKKYVYKIGFLNGKIFNNLKYYKRDLYKKYLRNIKWPLMKKIKKMVRR
mgnify:CR=1 FL=1